MGGLESKEQENEQSDEEDEETESDWSEEYPALEEWKFSFAKVTRCNGADTWSGLEAAGVDLREEYRSDFDCIRQA
jgi:hypothetical protein